MMNIFKKLEEQEKQEVENVKAEIYAIEKVMKLTGYTDTQQMERLKELYMLEKLANPITNRLYP